MAGSTLGKSCSMDVAFGGVPGVGVVVPERDSLALLRNDLITADIVFGRCSAATFGGGTRVLLNILLGKWAMVILSDPHLLGYVLSACSISLLRTTRDFTL